MKVYDVRDPQGTDDGIIVIGGFVGELIITFTCLLDYILASPQHQNFFFTVESIEQYLNDLFGNDEAGFPDNYCVLNLTKTLEELGGEQELSADRVAKLARESSNIADFGLAFMFEVQKELVLSVEVIETLYRALCKVAMKKTKDPVVAPEIPEDADEEAKEDLQNQIE